MNRHNKGDANEQLSNMVFSLPDTAVMWYEKHEDLFTFGKCFEDELPKSFGASSMKKGAKETLARKAQLPNETCTQSIEEILKLCKVVSPRMSEEDKVGHLLKGFPEDLYTYQQGYPGISRSFGGTLPDIREFENAA